MSTARAASAARVSAAAFVAVAALVFVLGAAPVRVVDAFPNLVLCGERGMDPGTSLDPCNRTLTIAQKAPLVDSDPYYNLHCKADGYTCVPVQQPIGTWFEVTLANTGTSRAGPFTVGLYSSLLVDHDSDDKACALDFEEPRKFAEPIARVQVSGLEVGAALNISFDEETAVHHWQASHNTAHRKDMHRCFFVYADDNNVLFEIQANERDNIALAPVKLLDLVDLKVTGRGLTVNFDGRPWLTGEVTNVGLVTAPNFRVDFYQIDTNDLTEDCPPFVNEEFPLIVDRFTDFWFVYLGSALVTDLVPNTPRLVLPSESRVPGSRTNVTNTCLLMLVDSLLNVPEPEDGPSNIAARTIAVDDIRRFLKSPILVILTPPWNMMIILYIACGVLGFFGILYIIYWIKKRNKQLRLNETRYLKRKRDNEPPPPEKKEDPIPFYDPDEEYLREEEAAAASNPDFHKPIRVGNAARKTGIVRDKKGNVIGTISAGGVIRDKNGKRIGVSAYGTTPGVVPKQPSRKVLDGYFGSSAGLV